MEQEALYLDTLTAGASYRPDENELLIMDKAGESLLHFRLLPNFYNNPALLFAKT